MNKTATKIDSHHAVNRVLDEYKYGTVYFADPTNNNIPIDTPEHVRAAWSYINHKEHAAQYHADDVKLFKMRIKRAAKKHGIEIHVAQIQLHFVSNFAV